MNTSFNYFLHMYRHDELVENIVWRAYDIETAKKPRHVADALKALGFEYAGELARSHFQRLYEILDSAEAESLLACWWLWRELSRGRHMKVPYRASGVTDLARSPVPVAQTPSQPAYGADQEGA